MTNLEEILIVNITGAALLLFLPRLRMKSKERMHYGDHLFTSMIWISFAALIVEIITFLIDGRPGTWMRIAAYLCNGYLFLASAAVGMLWILYVDYSIYHSWKRLQKRIIFIALPFLIVAGFVLCDLFGTGYIFYITEDNTYVRGPMVLLSYTVMFLYYIYSFVLAVYAIKTSGHVLFPVHYFVLPCMLGTLVQGMRYGITTGWFSVSLAFLLTQLQNQNHSVHVDDLSGLYTRRYYNYFIEKIAGSEKCTTISGIMMDINHFKEINDLYGHLVGDNAIRDLAGILTTITTELITAFRISGDEFVLVGENLSEKETEELIASLQKAIGNFNENTDKPYKLSLAIGYVCCNTSCFNPDTFFNQMDTKMYESKAEYYSQHSNDRRRTHRP